MSWMMKKQHFFVEPRKYEKFLETTLKSHFKNYLANFKLPKKIYFVSHLLRDVTGKVLKRILKQNFKDYAN